MSYDPPHNCQKTGHLHMDVPHPVFKNKKTVRCGHCQELIREGRVTTHGLNVIPTPDGMGISLTFADKGDDIEKNRKIL